ncbi:MAG: glycosyltransferase [Bryobacteraceae bacterium]
MTTLVMNEGAASKAARGDESKGGSEPVRPNTQKRFLFPHWEGGGNTPPMLSVARKLVGAGHAVRILSDECNRKEAEAAGASFTAWKRGAVRHDKSPESDPVRDWEVSSPPALLGRLRDRVFVGPALNRAQDVLDVMREFPADAVVTSEMLLGAMMGAERAGVPFVTLAANVCLFPLPGVPPFGPGLMPAEGIFGKIRDVFIAGMTKREFGKGTQAYNEARRALGLDSVAHPFDQLDRAERHLILTSEAFDFPSTNLPEKIVYAGPELGDPEWTEPWQSPWSATDQRPLVLVGFSTTYQNQADSLRKVMDALGGLDVRAVVTTGPSMNPGEFPDKPNVHLCESAPHSQLMKDASAVITHAGHGTVIRALAAGAPLLCMPMGRDQNDNAARVVGHGVGLRLDPKAKVEEIRQSVRELLDSPRYRVRARNLGKKIVDDARRSPAVRVLEGVATRKASPR